MVEGEVAEPTDIPEPENLPEESVETKEGDDKPNVTSSALAVGDGNKEPSHH